MMNRVLWMGCCLVIIVGLLAGMAGAQAIYTACELGQVDQVKTFLNKDPSLANSKDNNGFAPLHWAAGGGSRDVTAVLLAKGADVNARAGDGTTPLHTAAWHGQTEMVKFLLGQHAEANARRVEGARSPSSLEDGGTPLHDAVQFGRDEVVGALIAGGADVEGY